ncbi:hypothetical protein NHX12_029782 [Muraenolepis orangiensis]|uniref:Uncharacterized protein n=1 Tax=Muraenolepis orangiensis TaxID=630683 RepID=A0A9Q0IIU3_9TELE|nr:hypothetical protein NHX12_029782 [Muraenolepis orangiensis]
MRCEHADLLAVVATNHSPPTVATVLVLCVVGCVLTMLLCTLLQISSYVLPTLPGTKKSFPNHGRDGPTRLES